MKKKTTAACNQRSGEEEKAAMPPGAGMLRDGLAESFSKSLLENLPHAIFLKDRESAYIYCNENFAEDLGIKPGDIVGKTDYDFFPGHMADFYRSVDRKVVETGEIQEVEEEYLRNGREIKIHTVKAPAKDESGNIAGILGIFWDITERKKLEEELREARDGLELKVRDRTSELRKATDELRESEKKFKALFENIGDIIIIHDFGGRILEANASACEILGYGREELKKQNVRDMETPEYAEEFTRRAAGVRKAQKAVYPSAYLTREGKSIPVEVNSRVFDYGGEPVVLAVCRDITERLAAEEALFESAEELRKSLDKSVEALASASEKRDPYTSGHQQRVCRLARAIAEEMHLPDDSMRALGLAASIHDIGKLYVPAEILGKPRHLSVPEYAIVKLHTSAGYDITKKIDFPQEVARAILQHHERLDGSGYPLGLKAGAISTPARILAVADVVEAMTSHRPYRPAHPLEKALAEILSNSGKFYDPESAEICAELFRSRKFEFGTLR